MAHKLQFLVIHCTATPEGMEVSSAKIREWHLLPPPKGRGWKQVGYSEMIHLNGFIETLVPYNHDDIVDPWEITNGVAGLNSRSRHIVYVGGTDYRGVPKDTRNQLQKLTMAGFIRKVISLHPDIKVAGHNQFAAKACPSFDVPRWLTELGIPQKNIYRP